MSAALFLPGTPLLLPGIGGRDDPAAAVREAAISTLEAILHDHRPGRVLVVAPGPARDWSAADLGAAPVIATLTGRARGVSGRLPLGLAVGVAVLGAAGWTGPVDAWTVDGAGAGPVVGNAPHPGPELIIVVGDGSALRRDGGPDLPDPRAADTDEGVRTAIATGDPGPLAGLDPALAAALMITGAPVWRWLAGVVAPARPVAEQVYAGDPFGVFMIIARWAW